MLLRAGGAGLERGYAGLSSLLRAKREPEILLALVARGMFFLLVKWLALRAGQRQGGVFRLPPPYLWTPLSPQRVKGFSPLTIPKRKSKPKNASRFAKTGCGAQRPLRALSGTRVLLTAAPTAPPCIRRRAAVVAVAHFFVLLLFTAPPKISRFCWTLPSAER